MSISLGRVVYESYRLEPLRRAVEQVWKARIVVVGGDGNNGRDKLEQTSGYRTTTAPGNDPDVITAGAMKK